MFLNSSILWSPGKIDEVITLAFSDCKLRKKNKIEYYNLPCAFDIETTSFQDNDDKRAIMYGWTLGLNGQVIIGRTWEEFQACCGTLVARLGLGDSRRLVIYVHNLSFEFAFISHVLEWESVFAREERKPIKALTTTGIEFRCSYFLSGLSLEKIGENLQKYPVRKMVGDLNYKLLRHSKTPLTAKELKYMENDVRVVMSYIQEKIETDGSIVRIPLTNTGYVRRYCRNACMYTEKGQKQDVGKYFRWQRYIHRMNITSTDEFRQWQRCFQGGFTHCSAWKQGKIYSKVASYDFTSSYPAVMLAECNFPVSSGQLVRIKSAKEFRYYLTKYCCIFDIEFFGLEDKLFVDHPISYSRCTEIDTPVVDNGRVVSAKHLVTTITEIDFSVIEKFYSWERMRVGNFRIYAKGYLPTPFVKAILKLYKDKTQLKGVAGKEQEYLVSKGMINSAYGMSVTNPISPEIKFIDGEWITKPIDYEEAIEKYNNDERRFLFYPWGIYVTALARRNLFTAIYAVRNDFIYADTDSVKILNKTAHRAYFERYNKEIIEKLEKAMDYHGIDRSEIRPKTIKGIEKPLGVFDYEGEYQLFKSLGAKRYMVTEEYKPQITIAGLNKKAAVPYLQKKYGKYGMYLAFTENLIVPAGSTGKSTHTYIDIPKEGILKDYKGLSAEYHEQSGVHLEEAEYHLSLAWQYVQYLRGLREW